MKRPFLQDEAFLADVGGYTGGEDHFRVWWLGQSGFLLQWRRHRLLFDPYLSDSLTEKYANTDKPHVRITERVVAPELLTGIELVTSSHNHTDHLDAATLLPLRSANPGVRLVIPEANREFVAQRLQCDPDWPYGMSDGDSLTLGEFTFHAVPAAHEQVEPAFLGYVVRFGKFTVYHPGDTVLYDGMAERLRPFDIDLAVLPINGRKPERRVAGNLNGLEAATLAREAAVRIAIPCHYDLFEFNTALPDDFVRECDRTGQRYRVLSNGEGFTFSKEQAL